MSIGWRGSLADAWLSPNREHVWDENAARTAANARLLILQGGTPYYSEGLWSQAVTGYFDPTWGFDKWDAMTRSPALTRWAREAHVYREILDGVEPGW